MKPGQLKYWYMINGYERSRTYDIDPSLRPSVDHNGSLCFKAIAPETKFRVNVTIAAGTWVRWEYVPEES